MLVRTEVSKVPERWGLLGLLGGVRPALGICSSLRHQMPMFPVVTLCLLHSERWAVVFGVDCRLGAKVFMGKEGCVCVCVTDIPHLSPLSEGDIINSSSW